MPGRVDKSEAARQEVDLNASRLLTDSQLTKAVSVAVRVGTLNSLFIYPYYS